MTPFARLRAIEKMQWAIKEIRPCTHRLQDKIDFIMFLADAMVELKPGDERRDRPGHPLWILNLENADEPKPYTLYIPNVGMSVQFSWQELMFLKKFCEEE